jgi:DNA-binding NtrC family response regulator
LDEIADLAMPAQAALLRVLQEGEIRPVGASSTVKIDVRVVSATHKDLRAAIAAGAFREDLYARLAGFALELPPLRERREDLGTMIAAIVRRDDGAKRAQMTPEAVERMLAYEWPRNARELDAAIHHAMTMARGAPMGAEHLPPDVRAPRPALAHSPSKPIAEKAGGRRVDDPTLRDALLEALRAHRGNIARVAEALRTSRTQIHRWAERFGIDPASFRD